MLTRTIRHVSLKAHIQQCSLKMEKFIHSDAMTRACWAVGRHLDEEEEGFIPGKVDIEGQVVQLSAGDSPTLNIRQSDIGMEHIQGQHWRPRIQHARNAKTACENAARFFGQESGKQFQPYRAAHPEWFPLHPSQLRAGPAWPAAAFLGGRRGLGVLLTPAKDRMKANSTAFGDIWAGSYNTVAKSDQGHVLIMGLTNYNLDGTGHSTLPIIFLPSWIKDL